MGLLSRKTKIIDCHGRNVTKDQFQGGYSYACPACDGEGGRTIPGTRTSPPKLVPCGNCNGNGLMIGWT